MFSFHDRNLIFTPRGTFVRFLNQIPEAPSANPTPGRAAADLLVCKFEVARARRMQTTAEREPVRFVLSCGGGTRAFSENDIAHGRTL